VEGGRSSDESAINNYRQRPPSPARIVAAGSAAVEPITATSAGIAGLSPSAPNWAVCARFYCAKARLAIEIDGMSHDVGDRPERDLRRDAWLEARGVTVVRIPAGALIRNVGETIDAIVRIAAERIDN